MRRDSTTGIAGTARGPVAVAHASLIVTLSFGLVIQCCSDWSGWYRDEGRLGFTELGTEVLNACTRSGEGSVRCFGCVLLVCTADELANGRCGICPPFGRDGQPWLEDRKNK